MLTPTRELAIQVAEAIHSYGKHLPRLVVLPVYGGQPIDDQQRRLERGVHVVVGTPGRIMDHLRRGTLRLDQIRMVVLDEADEMLRMGFIEDVEWILAAGAPVRGRTPDRALLGHHAARGAAHRPAPPARARRPSRSEHKTLTVPAIEQRYLLVPQQQKLEALTRLLETEPTEAVLVFTRTKTASARGRRAAGGARLRGGGDARRHEPGAAREGDRAAAQRQLEIVVATDVAARGLDVERISHVVNYDIPNDLEVLRPPHRPHRPRRAGGRRHALRHAPRAAHAAGDRALHRPAHRADEDAHPGRRGGAADGDCSRRASATPWPRRSWTSTSPWSRSWSRRASTSPRSPPPPPVLARRERALEVAVEPEARGPGRAAGDGMVRLFLDAGRQSGVRPADIVGAIANEADVPGKEIGAIDIYDRFSLVEVPARFQRQIIERMTGATMRGRNLEVRMAAEDRGTPPQGGEQPRRRRPDSRPERPGSRGPRAPGPRTRR